MPSLFERPNRQITQTLGTSRAREEVRTVTQLRNAIGRVVAEMKTASSSMRTGAELVLTAPITLDAPIILPPEVRGLTISGRAPLLAASASLACAFDVRAREVTLRGLHAIGTSSAFFVAFVRVTTSAGIGTRVRDCTVDADRLFVITSDAGNSVTDSIIEGNVCRKISLTADPAVELRGLLHQVRGNVLPDGGGDSIVLRAFGGACVIGGNIILGGDITTSASLGANTIFGNTGANTITGAGSDQIGLNA